VPFLKDVEVHVRFLVALPLLIVAELIVHLRLRPVAGEFVVRGLIPRELVPRFEDALKSTMRLRNSIVAEIVMVGVVYALGVPVVWRELAALDVATWYADSSAHANKFTWAGLWYAYVSVPMFQFLLLRWYFRLALWTRFLWKVSRLKLNSARCMATAWRAWVFYPAWRSRSSRSRWRTVRSVAGTIANRIFHLGTQLADAKVEIAVVVVFLLVVVLTPLTFFAAQVLDRKRLDARHYGRLGQLYVAEFQQKWLPGGRPAAESPLGSGDIQSLADLANSLETVKNTRPVPITRQAVVALTAATLIPIAPLMLTVIPAEGIGQAPPQAAHLRLSSDRY
jgi:hypothetical protein